MTRGSPYGEMEKRIRELEDREQRWRQAAKDMAAENERLLLCLRSIGDGVITTDAGGKIGFMNRAAESFTGWTERDAVGESVCDVLKSLRSAGLMEAVLRPGGTVHRLTDRVLTRGGAEVIVNGSIAPVYDKDRIVGAIVVFRDMTGESDEHKGAPDKQKREWMSILANGIEHDFNNIMTVVIGNISLAKIHVKRGDKAFEKLEQAEAACVRARGLMQQFLMLTTAGSSVKDKDVYLGGLIRESVTSAAGNSSAECQVSVAEDLWPVEIADARMSQVISSLVINAVENLMSGGVLSVKAENAALTERTAQPLFLQPGRYIRVSIGDRPKAASGPGEREARDSVPGARRQGSSLGFVTAYSIVKRHSGHIDIEPEQDGGTTCTVYLPALPEGMAGAGPAEGVFLEQGVVQKQRAAAK